MARHIRKDDMVQIIAGDEKGVVGKVLRVLPDKNKVVVQGHNLVKKHVRPSRKNPHGGRINIEKPIAISNVLVVDPKTSKGVRAKYKIDDSGTKKRVSPDGTEINTVRRGK